MSSESELLAVDDWCVQENHAVSIECFSSSQLENLVHIHALLTAFFYRYDGGSEQQIRLFIPSWYSSPLQTSASVLVAGDRRLADIKSELKDYFGSILSGAGSVSNIDGIKVKEPQPGDRLLVFCDADYPIEEWLKVHPLADITALCRTDTKSLSLSFRSRFESIDQPTLDSLSEHFRQFAESVVYEGDQITVAEIKLLTAADVDFNALASPEPMGVGRFEFPHLIVEEISAAWPARTALRFRDETLDYETLNKRANQFAHYLKGRGVKKGAHCVVLVKPSFDTIIVMLAIFKVGAVYVPVDYEYPAQRIRFIVQDSHPTAILCTSETAGLVDFDDCKIVIDILEATLGGCSPENLAVDIMPDDEAYVFFTSGTTGQPKGVVGSYRNLHHYVTVAEQKFGMGPETVVPVVAKTSFSISFFETLTPLISGGTCVLLPRAVVLDVGRMVEVLRDVTMFHIGPSLLSRIIRKIKQDFSSTEFLNILHASSGGDMVPVELLHDLSKLFSRAEVYVIYGSSEIACMGCAYMVNRKHLPARTLVGKAFSGMQVKVVDGDMNELPPGWKGEICFWGKGVTLGYLNKPELTKEKYCNESGRRGFRIGDIGRVDGSGNIEILGRRDFQVKINGIRIELADIDYYLKRAPHITDAIAKAFKTENGDTVIYACVVGELSKEQIGDVRQYLSNNLPEYMHPKGFLRIDSLPLNHNLKVDRKALPDPGPHNLIKESNYAAPATVTEQSLAKIWESLLGIHPIGVDDDFFTSGGTSIQAIDLLVTVENQLKVTVSVNDFMQTRTIRSLGVCVDNYQSLSESADSVIKLQHGASDKAIFFIHDGEGDVLPYMSLSQRLGSDWSIFGIAPCAQGFAKMTHTSFEAMTDFYIAEIKLTKPEGPYILGGLCIGGFLAYCVGCKLQEQGDAVNHIILFDSHHIDAKPKTGREQSARNERLRSAIAQVRHDSTLSQVTRVAKLLLSKGYGYLRYQLLLGIRRQSRAIQIHLLKFGDTHGRLMHKFAPSVDATIRYAESQFRHRPRFKGSVVLFMATCKLHTLDDLGIDDTPYSNIFEDEGLGWPGRFDGDLHIREIAAGHSTLLTPPYVHDIARSLEQLL